MLLTDVFTPTDFPKLTYVERDQLHLVVGQGVLEQHDHRRVAPLAIPDETVDPPETVPEGDVYGIHH